MNSQFFYPINGGPKMKQRSIKSYHQSVSPKSIKQLTTRKRTSTIQFNSDDSLLPCIHTNIPQIRQLKRPQFKLNHLKTESSGEDFLSKLSPIAKFPLSTKQKTVQDEYEDYANHMANNSQIIQLKQQKKSMLIDQPLRPLKPVNTFINTYRIEKVKEQNTKESFMKRFEFTTDDWLKYGDRFPKEYTRVKILGKGGFSMIWLSEHIMTKERFALKQIPSSNLYQTHTKEIKFCAQFFDEGKVKEQYKNNPGVHSLVKLIKYESSQHDYWLFYEVCGMSIGTQLYDFSSQEYDNRKVYKLEIQKLTKILKRQRSLIFKFVQKMAESIDLLQANDIVHSDIKSENILIMYDELSDGWDIKLIDYGSSFAFSKLHQQFSMATPEYMCPELLNFILIENGQPKVLSHTLDKTYDKPWVIDVWSLGCVLLEIISGIPLWMSLDTLVTDQTGTQKLDIGLFAVKGRVFDKIIQKQISVCTNVKEYLQNRIYSGIDPDEKLILLLQGMLNINPSKRMHPQQIIKFCQIIS